MTASAKAAQGQLDTEAPTRAKEVSSLAHLWHTPPHFRPASKAKNTGTSVPVNHLCRSRLRKILGGKKGGILVDRAANDSKGADGGRGLVLTDGSRSKKPAVVK